MQYRQKFDHPWNNPDISNMSHMQPNTSAMYCQPDHLPYIREKNPSRINDTSIRYIFNSDGFRSGEFVDTDKLKILCSGCSNTMGVGVNQHETWPEFLGSMLPGAYIYNLSMGGKSMDWIARAIWNFTLTIKPDIIIVLETFEERFETVENNVPLSFMPSLEKYPPFYATSMDYIQYHRDKNMIMIDEICKSIGAHFISEHYMTLIMDLNGSTYPKARDGMHHGAEFNKIIAKFFYDKLQSIKQQ